MRENPKLKELKQIHDIIYVTKACLSQKMEDPDKLDINSCFLRSLINRHDVAIGEFHTLLFRKYLCSTLSLPKVRMMFKQILKVCKQPEYAEVLGTSQAPEFTKAVATFEFPQHFVKPVSVYMASALKQLLEQDRNVVAFVSPEHYHIGKLKWCIYSVLYI